MSRKVILVRGEREAEEIRIDESVLARLEKEHAKGITSAEILDVFARQGVALSEATLRKYVQLGLLPRSIRVGRKGKHQGSQGVYPVSVVRQILRIKQMMAESYTIEQIKRDVLFIRSDIQQLEATLNSIFATLGRVIKDKKRQGYARSVARDLEDAKALSKDLLSRLGSIEATLASGSDLRHVSASTA